MEYLHEDKELFNQVIQETANMFNISNPSIVEKDYFVTLILKKLAQRMPNIIFKGGTSLSKAYKIIKRFSEDIDLNLEEENLTQAKIINLSKTIESIICDLHFQILNADEIKTAGKYNVYKIITPTINKNEFLKPNVILETYLSIKSFPTVNTEVSSYIFDYLKEKKFNIIKQFQLEPYKVKVQSLERTFIDKIFAICDYYLTREIETHSRHLYDICKIYLNISFDLSFKTLVENVRQEREKQPKLCPSAQRGFVINEILTKIESENTYKNDYEKVTTQLIFEEVSYDEVIQTLEKIRNTNIF